MDAPRQETTRHDPAKRRQAVRAGAERGVRLYVAGAELRKAGIDPSGPAPTYRVWASSKGALQVRLYTD